MTDTTYFKPVSNLFQEYYKRNLSMGEYRAKRKLLLDQMDIEYNGNLNLRKNDIANIGGEDPTVPK